ncbi:MAG: hypothetical protein JW812_00170 [Alphaproteobacteria bacterium]|nr:hypothetical protein [Alphaproteobacteria bacterium]MBN2779646.1 hypothetical protein [Alphaproteobacteria bacterium]
MRYIFLFLMCFGLMSPAKALSDAELRGHFDRLGVEVISTGDPIQVRPQMCYQKRAVEIYDLIKTLVYITSVFFLLLMVVRIFLGHNVKLPQTILFLGLALGLIQVFPAILFQLTETDFRKETCPIIEYKHGMIQKEFQNNQKLKDALEKRKAAENLEKQKPTAESLWQRQRAVQNAEPN